MCAQNKMLPLGMKWRASRSFFPLFFYLSASSSIAFHTQVWTWISSLVLETGQFSIHASKFTGAHARSGQWPCGLTARLLNRWRVSFAARPVVAVLMLKPSDLNYPESNLIHYYSVHNTTPRSVAKGSCHASSFIVAHTARKSISPRATWRLWLLNASQRC